MPDTIFQTNILHLQDKNPELYQKVLQHSPNGRHHAVPTKSGSYTILSLLPNQEPKFLHSPENPFGEAEHLIKGDEFRGEDITILMGCGMGYLPMAITRQMHPEHRLFVIEANMDILHLSFQYMDLSAILSNECVEIFHSDQYQLINKNLDLAQFRVLGGEVRKVIYPPSADLDSNVYVDIEREIEKDIVTIRNNLFALEGHGKLTIRNILYNLIGLKEAAPIDPIHNMAKSKPMIVVAAGPSLNKNIHILKKNQASVNIIAVDAALKPLLDTGIKPLGVVSIDPIEANLNKVSDISSSLLEQIPLFYSPYLYPEIPGLFPGPKFVFNEHNIFCQWALDLWNNVEVLPYGFSVAHYAFYIARKFGADPIIFVGLDLALTDNQHHAAGCAETWIHDPTLTDYPTVQDIHGNQIPTYPGFIYMRNLFEREIANTSALCIDATEGGALIGGTKVMTLNEALNLYKDEKRLDLPRLIEEKWAKHRVRENGKIIPALEWLNNSAERMREVSSDALKTLKPLIADLDKGDISLSDTTDTVIEINKFSDIVAQYTDFQEILKDRLCKVLVNQFQTKYQIERSGSEIEKFRIEIHKSHLFFSELNKASESLLEHVPMVMEKLN